ncbi:MAG TPA: hypothetical protein VJS43_13990 [Candidatus Acidoferrales bacterium]|nr:hypothetical protein [Candidatus Acidoferrales bacterium]
MRLLGYLCLVAILAFVPASLPVRAAGDQPIGVIEVSQNANLDGLRAAEGSDFYAGEEFVTYQAGEVQLRVHHCRIGLGAMTNARFMPDATPDRLLLIQGTARYSCPKGAGLLIDTPAGTVRGADAMPASGMIDVTDAHNLVISAFDQGLVLDNDGELHLIAPGQSYRINVQEADADGGGQTIPATKNRRRRRKLAMILIFGGPTLLAGYAGWHLLTESPSKP